MNINKHSHFRVSFSAIGMALMKSNAFCWPWHWLIVATNVHGSGLMYNTLFLCIKKHSSTFYVGIFRLVHSGGP